MTLPAGTYWIGDPCYVLHEVWSEVCDLIISGHECLVGEFRLKDGRLFAMYHTAYGDGEYSDQDGHSYGVDSGSLGCVLFTGIDQSNEGNASSIARELGRVVTFEGRLSTGSLDGVVAFNQIRIDTTGDAGFDSDERYGDDYDPYADDQYEENGR